MFLTRCNTSIWPVRKYTCYHVVGGRGNFYCEGTGRDVIVIVHGIHCEHRGRQ